jgi:hypothetical protein
VSEPVGEREAVVEGAYGGGDRYEKVEQARVFDDFEPEQR